VSWRRYRFGLPSLTEPQNRALTTLICEFGGQAKIISLRTRANVQLGTVRALIARGLLETPDGRSYVQISGRCVHLLRRELHNPHPVPVMRAAVRERANQERRLRELGEWDG
jgi:hypothetical protein